MQRTYAFGGLRSSLIQVIYGVTGRRDVDAYIDVSVERLRRDERRIAEALGRPVRDLRVLEVGPGQIPIMSWYFGVHNRVVGLDLDVIELGSSPLAYARMLRRNGAVRVLKTLTRRALGVDRVQRGALTARLGVDRLNPPRLVQGDIAHVTVDAEPFDMVGSWSLLQHLPDPRAAVSNMVAALRPGGVLYTGLHLWTYNTGHHDIRAFSGHADDLPLWPHLRPETRGQVEPSAYLNRWRLSRWRELFQELTPGFQEFRETYDEEELRRRMTPELREALADYEDDELYTCDVFFLWRRPGGS